MLSVTPRHELVQTCDLVLGDAAENIGQPGLGIDAVELGSLDQGIAPADLLLSEHVTAAHSNP